ncbi:hypothetical protein [Candidatus Flexifilum breve]|uniref:hypothetical protein n=1 Tax=Candidatus Flexifilum breve TaxID=3140694 RepID=UPI0031CCAF61
MSDTATNNMNPLKPTQSGQEQLRQLKQEVAKLDDLLRVQQSTLRPYAVGLPADALRKASGMTSKMESLTLDLLNRQIELRQLRALAQTTALINSTLDTDEVLTQVMDTVIQLTGRGTRLHHAARPTRRADGIPHRARHRSGTVAARRLHHQQHDHQRGGEHRAARSDR